MKTYEVTYLLSAGMTDEDRATASGAADAVITDNGGTIAQNSEHTRRKLGYPVADERVGFMRVVGVELPAEAAETVRNEIRKIEGVLRVTVLADTYKEPVAGDIIDTVYQQQAAPKKALPKRSEEHSPTSRKPQKEVSMEEVEEKIEEALEEEVK